MPWALVFSPDEISSHLAVPGPRKAEEQCSGMEPLVPLVSCFYLCVNALCKLEGQWPLSSGLIADSLRGSQAALCGGKGESVQLHGVGNRLERGT